MLLIREGRRQCGGSPTAPRQRGGGGICLIAADEGAVERGRAESGREEKEEEGP